MDQDRDEVRIKFVLAIMKGQHTTSLPAHQVMTLLANVLTDTLVPTFAALKLSALDEKCSCEGLSDNV